VEITQKAELDVKQDISEIIRQLKELLLQMVLLLQINVKNVLWLAAPNVKVLKIIVKKLK